LKKGEIGNLALFRFTLHNSFNFLLFSISLSILSEITVTITADGPVLVADAVRVVVYAHHLLACDHRHAAYAHHHAACDHRHAACDHRHAACDRHHAACDHQDVACDHHDDAASPRTYTNYTCASAGRGPMSSSVYRGHGNVLCNIRVANGKYNPAVHPQRPTVQ
jgi:hypothetical protein